MFWIAPGANAQEISEDVKGALFHAAMAAGCPDNDDELSLGLAQSVLDSEDFEEFSARTVYNDAVDENPDIDEGTAALACGILEQIEQDHPFK